MMLWIIGKRARLEEGPIMITHCTLDGSFMLKKIMMALKKILHVLQYVLPGVGVEETISIYNIFRI